MPFEGTERVFYIEGVVQDSSLDQACKAEADRPLILAQKFEQEEPEITAKNLCYN